jgi:hypothetical protein
MGRKLKPLFLTQYSSFDELVPASNLAYLYARRQTHVRIYNLNTYRRCVQEVLFLLDYGRRIQASDCQIHQQELPRRATGGFRLSAYNPLGAGAPTIPCDHV